MKEIIDQKNRFNLKERSNNLVESNINANDNKRHCKLFTQRKRRHGLEVGILSLNQK